MNPNDLVIRSNVRELEGVEETEDFKLLVASIQARIENGQPPLEEPVVYFLDGAAKIIKHGHLRTLAARAAGVTDIFTARTSKPVDGYLEIDQIVANELRTPLNPMDIARVLGRSIRESGGKKTNKQLAALFGRSESWVSTYLALLRLEEPLRDAVEEGKLGYRAAYEATRIQPEDQVKHSEAIIAAKTVKGVKQVKRSVDAINAIERPPVQQLVDIGNEEEIDMETMPDEELMAIARMFEAARDFIVRAQTRAKELEIDTAEFVKRIKEVLHGT